MNILTPRYFLLGTSFVMCLAISNVVAGKLVSVAGIVLPAAVILFPLSYIFGDVLTEVYGFKGSRLVIWAGLVANFIMAVVFAVVVALPHPSFWPHQQAYAQVLGTTPRIVFASTLGYFCGEFFNAVVLSVLKKITRGRWLWTRTIGSTIVGEGVDTLIFICLAFGGLVESGVLSSMILAQYLFKVAYETAATPLTYLVIRWLKEKESLDIYDYGVKYNPFGLEVGYSSENLCPRRNTS